MIHNSNYVWKGIPMDAHAKVTSFTSVPCEHGGYDVTANVNKYTNASCEYDIEQTSEKFNCVSQENLSNEWLTSELLTKETWAGWTEVV